MNKVKSIIITVAIILVSTLFYYFGAAQIWDIGVSDWLNQRESVTNKKIYIIAIDDKTLEQYGAVNTWSRDIPAKLVEMLTAAFGRWDFDFSTKITKDTTINWK